MKTIISLILFMLGTNLLICFQGKILPIPELMKPASLAITSDRVFISEGANIHIYSMPDMKKIRTVGQEGEGPQEFMVNPGFGVNLRFCRNLLIVNSNGKMSLLNTAGDFISETKTGIYRFTLPFAELYVGQTMKIENGVNYFTTELLDEKMGRKRELWKWEHAIQDNKKKIVLAPQFQEFRIKGEDVVLAPDNDMHLLVFDTQGKRVNAIKLEYQNIPIDERYKAKVMNFFKTDPKYKDMYQIIEQMAYFPSHYPAIKNFFADENGYYIQTYGGREGESEFYIFSTKGFFMHKVSVPFQDTMGLNILPMYTVYAETFYQLVENMEDDVWELRATPLK